MTPAPPPRLHVFLARDADRAVVLRRGPSRWVRSILWDTAQDKFEGGQWFHGRIYEDKCDLSPNGKLFVFFAAKHGVRKSKEIGDIWTAISKPPYLTALALWPELGTYGGGGFFLPGNRLVLHTRNSRLARDFTTGPLILEDSRLGIHEKRDRDGWSAVDFDRNRCIRWAKPHPRLHLQLEFESKQKKYILKDGNDFLLEAEWADFDRRGRLAYSMQGKLYAKEWDRRGREKTEELADFSSDQFAPIEAPRWAQCW